MSKLFIEGGILFMSVLTIELIISISISAVYCLKITAKGNYELRKLELIKAVGTLAVVTGVLGQLIGLYSAFQAIAKAGDITQGLLMQGLRVSSITTIYGLIIMVVSYLLWFGLQSLVSKKQVI